jgi:hypothetical protein
MKKNCPKCKNLLIEVRKVFDPNRVELMKKQGACPMHGNFFNDYPKEIVEPGYNMTYHEYRFVCRKCKKEWVYDSLWRQFLEVPKDSQFFYSWDKKMLMLRRK